MDGTSPEVLVNDTQHPLSLAIDIPTKVIYWSTENPPSVSDNMGKGNGSVDCSPLLL